MKKLKLSKYQAGQLIEVNLAFANHLIAVKKDSMNQQARAFIDAFKKKGAKIEEQETYFIVDIFHNLPKDNRTAKLGGIIVDLDEDDPEVIEKKLCNFYIDMYSKAGFKVEY